MAIDIAKLEAAFKDSPELLAELKSTLETAGNAESISTNNKELAAQRKKMEKDMADLQSKLDEHSKSNKKKVDPADHAAVLERMESLEAKLAAADERAIKAEQSAVDKDISNQIIAHATDSNDPEAVLTLMRAKGLVGVNEGKTFFHKLDDKGNPVSADPKAAVAAFLEKNTYLRKSSGTQGAGTAGSNSPFARSTNADPLMNKKQNIADARSAEERIRAGAIK
jgi:hypothetical protein